MLGLDLITDKDILEKDSKYCSYADTAHYAKSPKVFCNCEGSYMYDSNDIAYLDLQMYFSAANFGYKNKRIIEAVIDQMNTLPQITPKYIHKYKVLLSEKLCKACEQRFGEEGRINFNVGGAQAVEDVIKLVRKNTKRNGFLHFKAAITEKQLPQRHYLQILNIVKIMGTMEIGLILYHFRTVSDVLMTKNATVVIFIVLNSLKNNLTVNTKV